MLNVFKIKFFCAPIIPLMAVLLAAGSTCSVAGQVAEEDSWRSLFNEEMSGWEPFLTTPHRSVKDLPEFAGKKPLGVNNDPKNVFTMKTIDGEPVLHVTGEIFGTVATTDEFSDFHFRVQYKWGEKKWAPRAKMKRDSGILYYCFGPRGGRGPWMESVESQVQEGDYGDLWMLGKTFSMVPAVPVEGQERPAYHAAGELTEFRDGVSCARSIDMGIENDWNTSEVIAIGDRALHIVNGKVVLDVRDIRREIDGKRVPLTKGRIELQSEGAEIDYRRCEIKPVTLFPAEFLGQIAAGMVKVKP